MWVLAQEDALWDSDFAWEILGLLAQGMWTTIQATIGGIIIALILGLLLALGRRAPSRWIAWPTRAVIEFIRSTPLLIQLFVIFFVLPVMSNNVLVFSPMVSLIIGLGIHYATYCSEAYRAGINSVPQGQWEASTALNLSTVTKWTTVILPQAIPTSIPALGNYFVAMFKDAPLGAAITLTGILGVATGIQASTFRNLEPITVAGILFLMVSIPVAIFVSRLERKYRYER
ncbi:MAG: ectoine/hydroxyectoine ABC transporter permease subunit EhuD [Acidimicrobiia bacterium]|nr:ectoine/hydroxyectoine ABC transporter permease subunit EhuD [Acidimicrobiia bacterium]